MNASSLWLLAASAISGLSNSVVYADLQMVDSIEVSAGINPWVQDMQERAFQVRDQAFAECAEVVEIDQAYLCGFSDVVQMNLALGRASTFVEGLFDFPKDTIVAQDDYNLTSMYTTIAGHDLRSADLLKYWAEMQRACDLSKKMCANDQEKELFEDFILPLAEKGSDFVVITFSLNGSMAAYEVVSHEILHAQYFLDEDFRAVVDAFWKEKVSAKDKKEIIETLSPYYDPKDALLMRNEFQAYILMAGAYSSMLSRYVDKYQPKLSKELKAAGITPIQVPR